MKRLEAIAKRWDDLAPGSNDVEDQYCRDVAHMTDLLREAIPIVHARHEGLIYCQCSQTTGRKCDIAKWLAEAEAEER